MCRAVVRRFQGFCIVTLVGTYWRCRTVCDASLFNCSGLNSNHALRGVYVNLVVAWRFECSHHGGVALGTFHLDVASAVFVAGDELPAVHAIPGKGLPIICVRHAASFSLCAAALRCRPPNLRRFLHAVAGYLYLLFVFEICVLCCGAALFTFHPTVAVFQEQISVEGSANGAYSVILHAFPPSPLNGKPY